MSAASPKSVPSAQPIRARCSAWAVIAGLGVLLAACIPDSETPPSPGASGPLASLQVSAGPLTPGFSPSQDQYEVTSPNNVTQTTIVATTAETGARLTINNQTAISGQQFGPIPLEVGGNNILLIVEPPGNQPPKSYTVVVTRAGVADLRALDISAGNLSPAFAPQTTSYAVAAANGMVSTMVTASLSDPASSLRINNQQATSGVAFGPIPLNLGANPITLTVSAPDGTAKVYTVTVNRAGPGNANLGGLVLSAGALSPAFSPETTAYSLTVPNATATTTVTAVVQVPTSTLTINGASATSGAAFGPLNLNVGNNLVTIDVRANDGVTRKTYTVTITRAAPPLSNNANLAGLTLSVGALTPAFNPATQSYSLSVPNTTTATTVTATVQGPGATITVNGTSVGSGVPSGAIGLNVGANSIIVLVRAQDGVTTKPYTVTVTRAAPAPSNNANLSGIVVSAGGTLRPTFNPNTTSYDINPPGTPLTTFITATVQGPGATLTINGAAATSGVPFGPIVLSTRGDTRVTIIVRAQNLVTTRTYTVDVER